LITDLKADLKEFLANANLSTYCINAFLVLMNSPDLDAKEVTKQSGVPIGRIYEVLEELDIKGLIEIHDSRPKKYSALPLNRAMYNLITYQTRENKRKAKYLFDQAKSLEEKLYKSNLAKTETSKIFYSTVFGSKAIYSLYSTCIDESQEELLVTEFINQSTLRVLQFAGDFFEGIRNALERGVQVKLLMSCEYDDRPLSDDQKIKDNNHFKKIKDKHEEFGLSTKKENFELKFSRKRIPIYFDIFDRNRVILKLQNPSSPWQISASLNIIDPLLAGELRKQFFNVWNYGTLED
jgi:sugar-specific transcriptional regulator TrmB